MRFFFERDFDRELEIERGDINPAAAAAEATALDARIAEARAAARAEGEAAGRAAARAELLAEREAQRVEALGLLAARMGDLVAGADAHRQALEGELIDFAVAVCERLAPEAVELFAEERLRAELAEVLRMVQDEGRVRVRVAAELRDEIAADITQETADGIASGRIEVAADPAFGPGDLRVEWDNGFMEYGFAATCDRLIAALHDIAGGARRPVPFRRKANV